MGIRCDTTWLALGDWVWVMEMVKRGVRFSLLPQVTSSFTDTGDNPALKPVGFKEMRKKRRMAPWWIQALRPALLLNYRMRLALRGASTRDRSRGLLALHSELTFSTGEENGGASHHFLAGKMRTLP